MSEVKTQDLAKQFAEYARSRKAHDVCVMDLRSLSSVTDFFVICHGDVDIHVKSIADGILEGAWKEGVKVWHKEGMEYGYWILLDFVDIVVHIFQKEARDFYGLERLWGDARTERLTD